MSLIERGPNKPRVQLEEVIQEFKAEMNTVVRAGMQTHEVQDALAGLGQRLDAICEAGKGLKLKVQEEEEK